jgi:XTP/dITP diphosphohydrolase
LSSRPLLVASTNPGKIREVREFLSSLPLHILTLADFPGLGVSPEEGRTFEENARGKSLFYSRATGIQVMAEDSGLEIDKLGGAPGVYSARFSGEAATDESNIDKVLALLTGVPREERRARFVCCIALSLKERVLTEIRGTVEGLITEERRGASGFGYDPIFYYPPLDKTFAQMTPGEKNSVSHRGRALRQLRDFLAGAL